MATLALSGCVYFNAMYNANRLFDQGVDEIEKGRDGSGRSALASSIEKAERIVERNPGSRWADDALRLITRARVLREEWPEAAESARRLGEYSRSAEDSAEVAGYLGVALLKLGEPEPADSLLSIALANEMSRVRQAELLMGRGQARAAMGRREEADTDLRAVIDMRPLWVSPRLERMRLLAAGGRFEEAAREYSALLTLTLTDLEERDVVAAATVLAERSPAAAVTALAAVEASVLLPNNRSELVRLRGDLRIALGAVEEGRADYQTAAALAPGSRPAAEARLALIKSELAEAAALEELDSLGAELEQLATSPGGRRSFAVSDLSDTFIRMDFWLSGGGLGTLLAAETARDELRAPRLARRLFLKYVDEQPEALWAPKALLAALVLGDLDSDMPIGSGEPGEAELRRRLLDDYGDSAYVQVYIGGTAGRFSFEELELGLRRQLERLMTLADQEVRNRRSELRQ